MIEYKDQFPCKVCYHPEEDHFIFEETVGGYVFLEDVGHEVWQEEPYPRPVCNACGNDCIFEQMTNLDFLEWKADEKEVDNNEIRS